MKKLIALTLLVTSTLSFASTQWLQEAAGNYSGYGSEYCSKIELKMGPSKFLGTTTGIIGHEAEATLLLGSSDGYGYSIYFGNDNYEVRGNKLILETNHEGAEYGDLRIGREWQRTELTLYKNENGLKRVEFATWRYNPLKIWSKKPLDGTLHKVTCDL